MFRCPPRFVAILAALPLTASAAEVTRIASSFEENDPFGMFMDVRYVRDQRRGEISREGHQDGDVQELSELRYTRIENRLDFDLRIGIWKDVEISYTLPVVLGLDQSWDYALGTDASNSTITNNCAQPNGELVDPNCATSGVGAQPIFDVPGESRRGGIGNMHFGIAYAIFNQRKDPTKPMWLLGFDYEAPTAALWDPTELTSTDARGAVGDRIHKYTLYTAFSKRIGVADPYFKMHYTMPFRGPGWYSNCDHPSLLSIPSNCGTAEWSREETGIQPAHEAGVLFGSEFSLVDDVARKQRMVLDLRAVTRYVSKSRSYNPLTDALQKLLKTSDFLEVGGAVGVSAEASDYLSFTVRATLLYATEHDLTEEEIGKDVSGDGEVQLDDVRELNPNFDYRYDMPSRRFRFTDVFDFRIDLGASFSF